MASFYSKEAETETHQNPCRTWVRYGKESHVSLYDVQIVEIKTGKAIDPESPTKWVQISTQEDRVDMFIPVGVTTKEFCQNLADHFARLAAAAE